MDVKTRREEYAESTRRALLDAAAERFATAGYAATSIEDVVRDARVTRGALYHHFRGKQELFEAVFAEVELAALARIGAAADTPGAPWDAFTAGFDAALDACLDPAYRRIALQEAPIALGPVRWREVAEQHSLGVIRQILEALAAAGELRPLSVPLLSRVLFATLAEAALTIAEADDEQAARAAAGELVHTLLGGLRRAHS